METTKQTSIRELKTESLNNIKVLVQRVNKLAEFDEGRTLQTVLVEDQERQKTWLALWDKEYQNKFRVGDILGLYCMVYRENPKDGTMELICGYKGYIEVLERAKAQEEPKVSKEDPFDLPAR